MFASVHVSVHPLERKARFSSIAVLDMQPFCSWQPYRQVPTWSLTVQVTHSPVIHHGLVRRACTELYLRTLKECDHITQSRYPSWEPVTLLCNLCCSTKHSRLLPARWKKTQNGMCQCLQLLNWRLTKTEIPKTIGWKGFWMPHEHQGLGTPQKIPEQKGHLVALRCYNPVFKSLRFSSLNILFL